MSLSDPRRWSPLRLDRPAVGDSDAEAEAVAQALVTELQEGWDAHDASFADRHLAADVAWGSPFGAVLHDLGTLHPIHDAQHVNRPASARSRFDLQRVMRLGPDAVAAHVLRHQLDEHGAVVRPSNDPREPFSEMTLYVLVRREGEWWVAAAQTTPVRPAGPA